MTLFLFILTFLVALLTPTWEKAFVPFDEGTHAQIINGKEAKPHSIPWQVFLSINDDDNNTSVCGASLISRSYVLTAAHCVNTSKSNGDFAGTVLLGAHNITEDESTQVLRDIQTVDIHPQFNITTGTYDIAILKLSKPVTFTKAIQAVTLPTYSDVSKSYESSTGKVSGWGITSGLDDQLSPVLLYEEDKIIANDACKEFFNRDIPHVNLCLGGLSERGSCNGDSGGPLTVNNKLIGIVSYGIHLCLEGYPSVFTRVTEFLKWIEDNSDVSIMKRD